MRKNPRPSSKLRSWVSRVVQFCRKQLSQKASPRKRRSRGLLGKPYLTLKTFNSSEDNMLHRFYCSHYKRKSRLWGGGKYKTSVHSLSSSSSWRAALQFVICDMCLQRKWTKPHQFRISDAFPLSHQASPTRKLTRGFIVRVDPMSCLVSALTSNSPVSLL